ncbi:hypothetical protein Rhow_006698 [Rhodococcus wratislaviensis]|uniref:Uncharacterized protein n=1 Tax=Rhodococcus wratislaviensis TaxID=44752 RepID=A0A402CG92_RHOWR|nr:hypothetical protein Rhow_006698 [Rhodococcus wratislaviensis]
MIAAIHSTCDHEIQSAGSSRGAALFGEQQLCRRRLVFDDYVIPPEIIETGNHICGVGFE